MTDHPVSETLPDPEPYRVLARKYRPAAFDGLIGQQAMVRTLTNAIKSDRLSHAFILTGVRGIGKTTTARIIARALNCVGPDGDGGPTAEPCGACQHCTAIAEDRHVDVLEMDAASRTGVDDIREVIESVRYRPTSARYKVYIIDEVHMLSRHAFNALLKTLEEPPEHVKFILATTEIRKVPVTVLSRCQRFDLRRVDMETLTAHFASIAAKEGADISPPALHLIARAADGSVRDGLSLLDQAISHGGGEIGEDDVRDMLGLADRSRTFDLLDAVMKGKVKEALGLLEEQYRAGADPSVVLEDMLELVHWLTRIKVAPEAAEAPGVPEAERVRGREMADHLSMAVVARAWQMLLKGLGETRIAPRPEQATEMVLIRLAYAADLPTPAEALKALEESDRADRAAPDQAAPDQADPKQAGPDPKGDPNKASPRPPGAVSGGAPPAPPAPRAVMAGGGDEMTLAPAPLAEPRARADEAPKTHEAPDPATFQAVVDLAGGRREGLLRANLINNVHLVHFEPGRIEFRPGDRAPTELAGDLSRFLNDATARRWVVTVSAEAGEGTLQQQEAARDASLKAAATEHPLVKAVMDTFPNATIDRVRKKKGDEKV